MGFEPTVEFPLHTLSKRAPSTTRTSLRLESITYGFKIEPKVICAPIVPQPCRRLHTFCPAVCDYRVDRARRHDCYGLAEGAAKATWLRRQLIDTSDRCQRRRRPIVSAVPVAIVLTVHGSPSCPHRHAGLTVVGPSGCSGAWKAASAATKCSTTGSSST